MPSSKNYVRNIQREYHTQKARGESGTGSNSENAKRHRDRRELQHNDSNAVAETPAPQIRPGRQADSR